MPNGNPGQEPHITQFISAYIDGRLAPAERQAVQAHLSACLACRGELASLQATVSLLRGLPAVALPRTFYIYPEQVPARTPLIDLRRLFRPGWAALPLRLATVTATMLFALVVSLDLLGQASLMPAAAPARQAMRAATPAESSQGAATDQVAVTALPETPKSRGSEPPTPAPLPTAQVAPPAAPAAAALAATPAPPATATPEAVGGGPAPVAAPSPPPPTSAGLAATSPVTTGTAAKGLPATPAPSGPGAIPQASATARPSAANEAVPPTTPTPAPQLALAAPTQTLPPQLSLAAPTTAGSTSDAAPAAPVAVNGLADLRPVEVALGALAVVLAVLTLRLRRAR
jgi:hypothetical protein